MLYAIHTDSPLIKDMEERQNRVLDADYSAVDIPAMVNELDISSDSKIKLRRTLEKFPELFGGGLGRLKGVEPAKIVLKKDATPFKGSYYNFPKAYQEPAKREVQRMVDIDVLEKLPFHNDSAWALPTFGVPKKTGDIRIVTDF